MNDVLFFDGTCGLCNGFVNFLLKRDQTHTLRFAPLQGEFAKGVLSRELRENLSTVVLYRNGKLHLRSDAALIVLIELGGIWKILGLFWLVPRAIRDMLYRIVAGNRYRWFGKSEQCRIPSPEERVRFLD